MKLFKIILCLVFIYSIESTANYFPVEKDGAKTVYAHKNKCESVEGQKCYNITGKDLSYHKIGFRSIDVEQTVDCSDAENCKDLAFQCPSGETKKWDDKANWPGLDFSPRSDDGWFIWCQKEMLVVDIDKKNAIDAQKAQESQVLQLESEGAKAIEAGSKAKAVMIGYIKNKGLTKAKRKSLRADLQSVIGALDVGSIDIAIEEIKALPEDPDVITPESKGLILKIFSDAGYSVQ